MRFLLYLLFLSFDCFDGFLPAYDLLKLVCRFTLLVDRSNLAQRLALSVLGVCYAFCILCECHDLIIQFLFLDLFLNLSLHLDLVPVVKHASQLVDIVILFHIFVSFLPHFSFEHCHFAAPHWHLCKELAVLTYFFFFRVFFALAFCLLLIVALFCF